MSGESIFGLYAKSAAEQQRLQKAESPYTGTYEKHLAETGKPTYSTFFEKGKEYDGTNVRFYKQREAVIGKNVGDTVDPHNFLKKGGGVRYLAPTAHDEKIYRKPPVDNNAGAFGRGGKGTSGNGDQGSPQYDADGNLITDAKGAHGAEGEGCNGSGTPGNGGDGAVGRDAYSHMMGDFNTDGDGDAHEATKNFVASNIIEVSNMVPKRRKLQEPLPTNRKDFGKTPAYLSRVKGEIHQEKAFVQSIENAKVQRQQQAFTKYVYMLPHDEQQKLMQDLRKRHDECVSELQRMPLSKDTIGMKKRKTELEKIVADVEVALKKLDRDALFIYRDDPVNGQWAKEAALKEAQLYAARSS